MSDDELFFVRDRQLEYPVFDVDNHMYENTDSFTKFMPKEYDGFSNYSQERTRTGLEVKYRFGSAITNPTVSRVAMPGGQDDDPLKCRSIAGKDAFYDVDTRYKIMQEYGIGRALMWPTLGSV